ncbi:transposon Tf2-6 polyprotein [Trichonephila clavipes]|nr:transposon Tf2-6 polyprotein [Trichonephila clavipes]
MPTSIKQLMTVNPPTSPTEWLMVATCLMKIQAPKPEQNTFRQNVPIRPRQNTFVPQNRYFVRPNFQNFNRMRPQHLPNQHAHNFNNRGFRPNHHTFSTWTAIISIYEIKEGCITPDNQNIETIKKLQPPKNVKQLQSFLGSVNVYNKFTDSYSKIREPLNQLLKEDKQWEWTAECQTAFELLKNKLITKPVLQLYDPKLPLNVFCDASLKAIGAILKQPDNSGTLHPVSFHSRTLREYEKKYCITELECLAIIGALDKFYYYLHVTKFPPAYLLFGTLPYTLPLAQNQVYTPVEEARKLAKENTIKDHEKNKIKYDARFIDSPFEPGDLVIYEEFNYPNRRKLSPIFSGPYEIVQKLSDVNYEITKPNALTKKPTEIVHVSKLRTYYPPEELKLSHE